MLKIVEMDDNNDVLNVDELALKMALEMALEMGGTLEEYFLLSEEFMNVDSRGEFLSIVKKLKLKNVSDVDVDNASRISGFLGEYLPYE